MDYQSTGQDGYDRDISRSWLTNGEIQDTDSWSIMELSLIQTMSEWERGAFIQADWGMVIRCV